MKYSRQIVDIEIQGFLPPPPNRGFLGANPRKTGKNFGLGGEYPLKFDLRGGANPLEFSFRGGGGESPKIPV